MCPAPTDKLHIVNNSARVLIFTAAESGTDTLMALAQAHGCKAISISDQRELDAYIQTHPVDILMVNATTEGAIDAVALFRRRSVQQYSCVVSFGCGNEVVDTDLHVKDISHEGTFSIVLFAAQERLALLEARDNSKRDVTTLREELRHQKSLSENTLLYLEAANRRFDTLFENLPVACYSCDPTGCILAWNRAAVGLFGFAAHEALTRQIWKLLTVPDQEAVTHYETDTHAQLRRVSDGEALMELELQVKHKHGRAVTVIGNCFPIRGSGNSIVGVLYAWVDITRRKELERQVESQLAQARSLNVVLEQQRQQLASANIRLAELVTQDPLTDVKNRTFVIEQIDQAIAYYRRHRVISSIVMVDIERFMDFNRRFGTDEGDRILRTLAHLISKTVRPYDTVARYDGEEFVMLLPHTDAAGSVCFAERLQSEIDSFNWQPAAISVHIGIETLNPESLTPLDVLECAEKALKLAVSRGKGGIGHASEIQLVEAA